MKNSEIQTIKIYQQLISLSKKIGDNKNYIKYKNEFDRLVNQEILTEHWFDYNRNIEEFELIYNELRKKSKDMSKKSFNKDKD